MTFIIDFSKDWWYFKLEFQVRFKLHFDEDRKWGRHSIRKRNLKSNFSPPPAFFQILPPSLLHPFKGAKSNMSYHLGGVRKLLLGAHAAVWTALCAIMARDPGILPESLSASHHHSSCTRRPRREPAEKSSRQQLRTVCMEKTDPCI